jgi:hypothetical protein
VGGGVKDGVGAVRQEGYLETLLLDYIYKPTVIAFFMILNAEVFYDVLKTKAPQGLARPKKRENDEKVQKLVFVVWGGGKGAN